MGMYFSEEDKEQLMREVSVMEVIDELHLDTKRCGSSISILCPAPEHNDRHFGSCKVNSRGKCVCYACNRSFSTIDLLMMEGGLSFYEAMCTLAQLSGHPQDFEQQGKKKENIKPVSFKKLTAEQKKLLGFAEFSNCRAYMGYSFERPDAESIRDETGHYIIVNGLGYNPWRTLSMEEPELFDWMIRNKCKERLVSIGRLCEKVIHIAKSDCNQKTKEFYIGLIQGFKDIYNEILEIYLEYDGKITGLDDMERNLNKIHSFFSPLTEAA